MQSKPLTRPGGLPLRSWVAILSLVASLLNVVTATDIMNEWWLYGALFFLIAGFEAFYMFILLFAPWQYDDTGAQRPALESQGLVFYVLGILGLGVTIALYIATRTTGLPFLGSSAQAFHIIRPLDLLTRAVEVILIGLLALLIQRRRQVEV